MTIHSGLNLTIIILSNASWSFPWAPCLCRGEHSFWFQDCMFLNSPTSAQCPGRQKENFQVVFFFFCTRCFPSTKRDVFHPHDRHLENCRVNLKKKKKLPRGSHMESGYTGLYLSPSWKALEDLVLTTSKSQSSILLSSFSLSVSWVVPGTWTAAAFNPL